MFFQISPVIHKKPKSVSQITIEDEDSQVETLSLAPFTSNPKIVFNNVPLGTIQTRKLLIKNPTGHDLNLFIKKDVPEEMKLVLSWKEAFIAKGSECILEMTWEPTSEEACRHTIILSDGRRINRDIGITFKSINPKRSKASGTKKSSKQKRPLVTFDESQSISPTKKLRTQTTLSTRYSFEHFKSVKYCSPPQKGQQRQFAENNLCRKEQFSEVKRTYTLQTSAWDTAKSNLKAQFYSEESKENLPPVQQRNSNASFISSTEATFSLENEKTDERRYTYTLNPHCERGDTYVLQTSKLEKIVETNNTFELKNKLLGATESFYLKSEENSPCFRDSLDSPVLKNRDNREALTPSLESMLNITPAMPLFVNVNMKGRTNQEVLTPSLATMLNKSPAISPYTNADISAFLPLISSTNSKPPSNNNSYESTGRSAKELFNDQTYTKTNTSSETYVKGNSSFETYIKSNISGDTYVKDDSIGDLRRLDVSPLSSRALRVPSPVFLKPKLFELPQIAAESRIAQNLSAIAEESSIFNDSCFKTGFKRKSPSFSSHKIKRERASIERRKDWSKTGGTAIRIKKSTSGLDLKKFQTSSNESQDHPLSSISETRSNTVIVKNPFLFANIVDPFMTSQIYSHEKWMDEQENNFKKWLNALLTPPDDLDAKNEVDVAKVWHECMKKEVGEAPSKQDMSVKYHTNKKLDNLRKQAQIIFRSKEMGDVLQKSYAVIDSGKLSIREDKDLHLNLELKSTITRLILGYNPLWLRIGLETIYNEIIPLKSNSDLHGLAVFILERFFKDPHLIKKYKTIYASKYSLDLKKFILKKFLTLVYFLDRAKSEKLIRHDPCLFCKNAPEKESKLVLTHFARETLSSVGDIIKFLRRFGYTVTHVQSYIHEFDYAVKNLGGDLRDGVRLTKVMELIQMRSDLTDKLRVPAISRLQKIHNMELVFKSLEESGYEIQYEITPRDIVDGHKEKSLSFLWQIIYKFEAPLMVKCATTIQTWFRSLPVQLKRRKLRRLHEEREFAAKKIQKWYRHQKMSQKYFVLAELIRRFIEERKRIRAAIKIQSFYRMLIFRRRFLKQYDTIIKLQSCARGWLLRHNYKLRIDAAIIIQRSFRKFICRKRVLQWRSIVYDIQRRHRAAIIVQNKFRANKLMLCERKIYVEIRMAIIKIQSWYRSIIEMRACRKNYILLKKSVVITERRYLALKMMKEERSKFVSLKRAALVTQRRYRATIEMRNQKMYFEKLRNTTMFVQRKFRANKIAKNYRSEYFKLKCAAIVLQRRFRLKQLMTNQRKIYEEIRSATVKIQLWYRSILEMRSCRENYILMKKSVLSIEHRYLTLKLMRKKKSEFVALKRATLIIQRRYRATTEMKNQRKLFEKLKQTTVSMQRRFRTNKMSKNCRSEYLKLKSTTIMLQRIFRANKLTTYHRRCYIEIRTATIKIQSWYRSIIEMRACRQNYILIKRSVFIIERRYLALKAMRQQKSEFLTLKKAATTIQRRYRAIIAMRNQKSYFEKLKQAAIFVQRRFRAKKIGNICRSEYFKLKATVITLQRIFRGKKLTTYQRRKYIEIRSAIIKIQSWYRSIIEMRTCRQNYVLIKRSVLIIEHRYLALKVMRQQQSEFSTVKKAVLVIQRRYRAIIAMRNQKSCFDKLRHAAIFVQQRFRAKKMGKICRSEYLKLKATAITLQRTFRDKKLTTYRRKTYIEIRSATIKIQSWYRSIIETRTIRQNYLLIKRSVLIIEHRYLALKVMKQQKSEFSTLKKAVIVIQRRYRAIIAMRNQKLCFDKLRHAAIFVQQRFRAKKTGKICRSDYLKLKATAITVQRIFRSKKLTTHQRKSYIEIRSATIKIQSWYRSIIETRTIRQNYLLIKKSVVIIEHRYLALKGMRQQIYEFSSLKKATIMIQRRYRAIIAMRNQKSYFDKLRHAAIFVQRRFRAKKMGNICRSEYLKLKSAAVVLQRRFRARQLMISYVTQYTRIKWAVLVIQHRLRAQKAMNHEMLKYTKLRHATFVIQRKLRATILTRIQRTQFLEFKRSIVTIQRYYKSYWVMKRQREWFLTTRSTVSDFQRFARGYLIRKKYAPLLTVEAVEARRILKKQNVAAIKIQAAWKGHRLRQSQIPVMVALRKRREIEEAKPRPSYQGRTLAQRCDAAMLCMTSENSSVLMIINALEDLDFITRHSQNLCMQLSLLLPSQLYIIITSAARSLPEMKALKTATLILINFCKYPHTREASWNAEYMDGIVNVLLNWCDKEAPLFLTLCTLLWLFAHEEKWKKVILALPNVKQRFSKIHTLVTRKQNMVIKSKKCNYSSPFGVDIKPMLPTRTAHWGLDYDRPNTFTNAVYALSNLMMILDM